MEVLHEHEKKIRAGGDPASAGKSIHTVRNRRHDFLHSRLQGGILGPESARLHWSGRLPQARLQHGSPGLRAGPQHHQAHSAGSQVSGRASRGCPGRRAPAEGGNTGWLPVSGKTARRMRREILCLQQQMAFLKKVMRLHDKPGKQPWTVPEDGSRPSRKRRRTRRTFSP